MCRLCIAITMLWCVLLVPKAHAEARFFPETGFTVEGRFLEYWQANGGLPQFGFPISAVVTERGEDGRAYQTQYFERNRFELHQENAQPYDVLLGRLGVASLQRRGVDWRSLPGGQPAAGCQFFAETGHNMCGAFASYWHSHGGLAIFGFPITEAHQAVSATDGKTYLVQYFERNRFEWHPENRGTTYEVLLGLLGSEIYGRATQSPKPDPAADRDSQRLLELINQARGQASLARVAISAALTGVAVNYSQVQAAQGGINHTGPDGSTIGDRVSRSGYRWSMVAENLAAGYPGPDEVFAGWMNSAGHRDNILNPQAREIGVGHTHRDNDPSRLGDYWVLVLAAPR